MKPDIYLVDKNSEDYRIAKVSVTANLLEEGWTKDDISIILDMTEFGSDYKWHCKFCTYADDFPDQIVLYHLSKHKDLVKKSAEN